MRKTVFLYSGEGTKSSKSSFKLLKTSSLWGEIEKLVEARFSLSLEQMWQKDIDEHRGPESVLLTVITGICLSDIWKRWGYQPDIVVGHSVGELTAAFEAGFYTLEQVVTLAHEIGCVAQQVSGRMYHGFLTDEQINQLTVSLSSLNFSDGPKKHVTISCTDEERYRFEREYPEFIEMKPGHPWHHRKYSTVAPGFSDYAATTDSDMMFVSGVTAKPETEIKKEHWGRWFSHPIDFITTVSSLRSTNAEDEFDVVEIGFHPVLESCCQSLGVYRYVSSMYRGEDEIQWILFQRTNLHQAPFIKTLLKCVDQYKSEIDFETPLAYQGFTSLNFIEFSVLLEPYFPGLVPQDFYRFKSVQELMDRYGKKPSYTALEQTMAGRNKVVVSGMSCKFPASVSTPFQFWEMLLSREDQVREEPERGDYRAGFLDGNNSRFDHRYFNISEAEARAMDPQQILALQLTELLIKDAGLDLDGIDRKRVGVYIGVWNEEYQGNRDSVYYPTGTNPSIIASRISYHYDLRGPSWVVNTACSSSLLAVHYASKDIEAGRIDYAIAGGVNMLLGNEFTHSMRDSGFLSEDGRCKAFDDSANGYVRAEGGGLVLLTRKELAPEYYVELLGSSVNQNGGLPQVITAPHPEAQEELIRDACMDAAISPQDISYVECHGTGTKIGDPIEISALQNTIARERDTVCHLGSVKSNMGHLESAAGIAGLIKSILSLNNGLIPPNLHFTRPNQFIDFASYNLRVVNKETPIDPEALVGVSSFGFGGVNAHVILKGGEKKVRKAIKNTDVPFDLERATPITSYYQLEREKAGGPLNSAAPQNQGDVRTVVGTVFTDLTGIKEIDPDVDLTDQGLDSLSATEFVATLEKELTITLDTDLLFDYPFVEELIRFLEQSLPDKSISASSEEGWDRSSLEKRVAGLFYELTNIKEIDPDLALTDQGLDSLSGTQLISQLETELKIEIDTDILFEYPLYDQLVDEIYATTKR